MEVEVKKRNLAEFLTVKDLEEMCIGVHSIHERLGVTA